VSNSKLLFHFPGPYIPPEAEQWTYQLSSLDIRCQGLGINRIPSVSILGHPLFSSTEVEMLFHRFSIPAAVTLHRDIYLSHSLLCVINWYTV
jgi:hypothetical protein